MKDLVITIVSGLMLLLFLAAFARADPPGMGLREFPHVAQMLDENVTKREIDQRFSQLERDIDRTKDELNERLKGMNEFRTALNDIIATYSTRISTLEALAQRIAINTELLQKMESQIAVINTAGSPYAIEQIRNLQRELAEQNDTDDKLETRIATIEVAASTSVKLWQLIAAALGMLGVIYGIVHFRSAAAEKKRS